MGSLILGTSLPFEAHNDWVDVAPQRRRGEHEKPGPAGHRALDNLVSVRACSPPSLGRLFTVSCALTVVVPPKDTFKGHFEMVEQEIIIY